MKLVNVFACFRYNKSRSINSSSNVFGDADEVEELELVEERLLRYERRARLAAPAEASSSAIEPSYASIAAVSDIIISGSVAYIGGVGAGGTLEIVLGGVSGFMLRVVLVVVVVVVVVAVALRERKRSVIK